MSTFDSPNISVSTKSNEQNLLITKSYLTDLASQLNYKIASIEDRLEALEAEVSSLASQIES